MIGDDIPGRGPVVAAGWIVLALGVGVILVYGRNILVPLAIALLLWHLINGIASSYTRTAQFLTPFDFALPRALALLLGGLTVLVLLLLSGQLVADSIARLTEETAALRDALGQSLPMLAEQLGMSLPKPLDDLYAQIPFGSLVAQTASSLTQIAGSAGLIAIYVLFLLFEQRSFDRKLDRLFPNPVHAARARTILDEIEERIEAYLRIKTFMSLLTGTLSYTVLVLFGVDYAGFWALLIFLLNYIPNIGSILAVTFPVLFSLVQLQELLPVAALAVILASLQFVIGNLLEPRLMGHRLNLSPLVIIISLAFWGSVWGIPGLFLSVPLTMLFAIVCAQVPQLRLVAVLLSIDGRVD